MMIRLKIDEYCQDCPYFTADVHNPPYLVSDNGPYAYVGDTIVSCINKNICKHVAGYYRSKEESDGREEM